jgi:Ca-activated chloride channel family protein
MRFSQWQFLIPLLALPFCYRYWLRANLPPRLRFSSTLFGSPQPSQSPPAARANGSGRLPLSHPIRISVLLKVLALAFFLIALARPQRSDQQLERTVSGVDIILLLDVSGSMRIEDLADRSRIEVAKETFKNFVMGRQNDRIGYVTFSGEPLSMVPPTLDYGLVLQMMEQTSLGLLKDGTAIGDGLALAVSHLKMSRAKSRVIILLTDGDNNLGQVDPATAGELAKGYGIRVYTIAIGREGRVKMPVQHRTLFGNTVTSYQWLENALNPELLKQIAEQTHGKFYRVTEAAALESVFQEIDQLEKSEVQS